MFWLNVIKPHRVSSQQRLYAFSQVHLISLTNLFTSVKEHTDHYQRSRDLLKNSLTIGYLCYLILHRAHLSLSVLNYQ